MELANKKIREHYSNFSLGGLFSPNALRGGLLYGPGGAVREANKTYEENKRLNDAANVVANRRDMETQQIALNQKSVELEKAKDTLAKSGIDPNAIPAKAPSMDSIAGIPQKYFLIGVGSLAAIGLIVLIVKLAK